MKKIKYLRESQIKKDGTNISIKHLSKPSFYVEHDSQHSLVIIDYDSENYEVLKYIKVDGTSCFSEFIGAKLLIKRRIIEMMVLCSI